MPLPELDLTMRYETRFLSEKWNDREDEKIVIREDNRLKQYEIQLLISDKEIGSVSLRMENGAIVEMPTYKLTVTDTKTQEISVFEVTRDMLHFTKTQRKKSIFSFLGITKFDKTTYLYENIVFEPEKEDIDFFKLSKYRKLSQDTLIYDFERNTEKYLLYAGNISNFEKPNNQGYYIVTDGKEGQSFIADILYREKILKRTPKVTLKIIKRSKVAKEFAFDPKGKLLKRIYL